MPFDISTTPKNSTSMIGTITAGVGACRFLDAQGKEIALQRLSYSHF